MKEIGGYIMELDLLNIGDRVRTHEGDVGTVVDIAKLTVFVRLEAENDDASLKAYLASQLIRIDPPSAAGPTWPSHA